MENTLTAATVTLQSTSFEVVAGPVVEWIAFGVGTIGTVLWALDGKGARWASVLWLISSFFWIGFAWLNNHSALFGQDLISVGLNVFAIWKHFFSAGGRSAPAEQ